VGLAGPEACIYVLLEGREDAPRVFAQLTNCDGAFLVGREEEVFSWENLRGKTVIGGRKGGVPEMTLEYVMKQNGVIPHEDAVVDTSVQFNMMAGAFTGGNGDYVALFEPTATEVELAGQGYVLCSIGEESGEIPYTCFMAKKSYIEKNKTQVKGFLRALQRALCDMKVKSPEEIGAAIAPSFTGTSVESLAASVKRYLAIDAWMTNMAMTESSFIRLQTVMMSAGELKEYASFSALANNALAEEVYGEVTAV
jgi:NitT/TauT family transport system substrate-binding protein